MDGHDHPAGERRSPTASHGVAAGLPIFSTEPLTASERMMLEAAAKLLRASADLLDAAIRANSVSHALGCVDRLNGGAIDFTAIAARLGSRR